MTIIARLAQEAGEPVPNIVLAKLTTLEEEINEDTRIAGAVDKIAHGKKVSAESHKAYQERMLQEAIERNQRELDRLRKGL
jgi:chemotaxis response regulator CheB